MINITKLLVQIEIRPKNQTIQTFLDNARYKKCQNIKINWLLYSSNKEIFLFKNESLQKRFKKQMFNEGANIHIKSMVRGNLIKNIGVDGKIRILQ